MKLQTVKNLWATLVRDRRGDFIGGEIEHYENPEGVYRGPIKSIEIKGDKVIVTTLWTAHVPANQHGMPLRDYWVKETRAGAETFTYELGEVDGMGLITGQPQNVGDNRVHFLTMFGIGRVTLFPKGGSKMNRSKVRGL